LQTAFSVVIHIHIHIIQHGFYGVSVIFFGGIRYIFWGYPLYTFFWSPCKTRVFGNGLPLIPLTQLNGIRHLFLSVAIPGIISGRRMPQIKGGSPLTGQTETRHEEEGKEARLPMDASPKIKERASFPPGGAPRYLGGVPPIRPPGGANLGVRLPKISPLYTIPERSRGRPPQGVIYEKAEEESAVYHP